MVVLSSFDRMTSIQLCISLLTDKEFVELRNSKEGRVWPWQRRRLQYDITWHHPIQCLCRHAVFLVPQQLKENMQREGGDACVEQT